MEGCVPRALLPLAMWPGAAGTHGPSLGSLDFLGVGSGARMCYHGRAEQKGTNHCQIPWKASRGHSGMKPWRQDARANSSQRRPFTRKRSQES